MRIRDAIVKRQALDRIMIGFNGVKRAKTSNRSENPLLQDVNKGWLQKIREDAPDHVMGSTTTGGETTPGAVKVGKGGEYANLDAVVMDAVNELIDVVYGTMTIWWLFAGVNCCLTSISRWSTKSRKTVKNWLPI